MSTYLQPYEGSFLSPSFEKATVADAMRTRVMSCPRSEPAVQVARLMADYHVHAVVVDGAGEDSPEPERVVSGVVSDMDVVRATSRV
jgi:CBS domain-containing protein